MKFRVLLIDHNVDDNHPAYQEEILVAKVPPGEFVIGGISVRGFGLPAITVRPGMDVVLRFEP